MNVDIITQPKCSDREKKGGTYLENDILLAHDMTSLLFRYSKSILKTGNSAHIFIREFNNTLGLAQKKIVAYAL